MNFLDRPTAIKTINQLASEKRPFLLIASFDTQTNIVLPLSEIDPSEIAFDFNGKQNNIEKFTEWVDHKRAEERRSPASKKAFLDESMPVIWQPEPIPFARYQSSFTQLMMALKNGEISLANLTFPTLVKCNLTLPEIFQRTQAKYRLWLKGEFCSFSPETFITIKDNVIATYPMKGTINAAIPNALERLMEDPKEIDEHETVAQEAIRDISLVANNARITRFRYIDRISRGDGEILQSSSMIEGDLPKNYRESLGDLFYQLLPAGSITGSPRDKATEILTQIESYSRHFYSGVAAIFDGENLDSTVLIRYLEEQTRQNNNATDDMINNTIDNVIDDVADDMADNISDQTVSPLYHYTFKSGGGITAMSNVENEYHELIEKIYLPIS